MSIDEQSSSPLNIGIGAVSPLWPAFAMAAGTGAVFYLMSRWSLGRWQGQPTNLEALLGAPGEAAETMLEVGPAVEEASAEAAEASVDSALETPAETVKAAAEAAPSVVDAASAVEVVASAETPLAAPARPRSRAARPD